MIDYLFSSNRLGFRNWTLGDLDPMAALNDDADVMEFFPFKPSRQNTEEFIVRMQQQFAKNGFCYFAVDLLETNEFIGFVGLCEQNYLEGQDTFVDIGWRLKKSVWNKGYATEGAKACLDFGFTQIGLHAIYSVASEINTKSELIMKKIGMEKIKTFDHPKLVAYPELVSCVLYKTSNNLL